MGKDKEEGTRGRRIWRGRGGEKKGRGRRHSTGDSEKHKGEREKGEREEDRKVQI